MKVCVIGAGVFGCQIALKLAASGHEVVLYEKNSAVVNGAT
jgi:Trk K+ transport system NAD-binding subunit